MKDIDKRQFDNILKFLLTLGMAEHIFQHSPDYVIAKFNRFIGTDYDINDYPEKGLHPLLEPLIGIYHDRWPADWPMKRIGS